MRLNPIVLVGTFLCAAVTPGYLQEKFNIAESINRFSVDLLDEISREGGDSLNIALSPLTLWTLLTIVSEGALDSTADQLDNTLRLPHNKLAVRNSYQKLSEIFKDTSNEAEFETSNGIFTNEEFPVKQRFVNLAKQYYGTSITPVNFQSNNEEAARIINKYVATATRNRIPVLVNAADVRNAYLFITSTMYFKGQWKTPFNRTATEPVAFLDDQRNKIGEVNMMYQSHPYPYGRIDKIKADAVELPYGFDDKYVMLLLVPRGSQTVSNMLDALTRESITDILAVLKRNNKMFSEEDINVFMPKFKIVSDFNMDRVLDNMGIKDVFDPARANLLGMFPHYLFLSRVIQKAEIEVDEEGTVASGAAGAVFVNRTPPPVVRANRPFLYFIIQKDSGTIIFAGKLSNPNTLTK